MFANRLCGKAGISNALRVRMGRDFKRHELQLVQLLRSLPPHPGPLPKGEGETLSRELKFDKSLTQSSAVICSRSSKNRRVTSQESVMGGSRFSIKHRAFREGAFWWCRM